jgi:ubiquinone/menaquinone biosynthesis C-methylase UbiE
MKTRFDVIGKNYERAISLFPKARTDEDWLIRELELKKTDKVLEITAGTGFLTEKILPKIYAGELVAQDISPEMLTFNKQKCKKFNNVRFYLENDMTLPKLDDDYFDKAVCLGGFHHIENQICIVKTLYSKLKKNGVLCIGDFADNSPVQQYFDEKIDKITSTGHIGFFLSVSRMVNLGRVAGFSKCEAVFKKVPFNFTNKEEVGIFYQLVHGLKQDPKETLADVTKYMGIEHNKLFSVPMDYIYAKYIK